MAFAMIRTSMRPMVQWMRTECGSLSQLGTQNLPTVTKFSTSTVVAKDKLTLFEHARDFSKHADLAEHDAASESDSDSDKDERKGTSLFWRRKMRTMHSILDVNKDGVISFEDFLLLADKFGALGNLSDEALKEFRETMQKTWEHQWGEMSPYNLVTVEQYLTDLEHVLNDKDLKKKANCFLPYFFRAIDADHDGLITLKEFKLFYQCLGLTEEDAAVAFHIIDENDDGKLSQKEFEELGKDFFLTEDEKRISRMFWGPLIEH